MGMLIADILREKGAEVTTVDADSTVKDAVSLLVELKIGAVPVSVDGNRLEGIVSERDIVRAVAEGSDLSTMKIRDLMTVKVHTCSRDSRLSEVMTLMNERRIRHVPVIEDDRLVGILSIRDLVDARLREAEVEREQMAEYIANRTFN